MTVLILIHSFQSTLPLRGATFGILKSIFNWIDFNPRSPYGERPQEQETQREEQKFQSTLPLRGATPFPFLACLEYPISIHAPLTGSDMEEIDRARAEWISIHAPLTGSDCPDCGAHLDPGISIHAPLTGSDLA